MQIVLFEDERWKSFLPLTFTRPVGELRCGIYTIAEKWKLHSALPVFHRTRSELRKLFACDPAKGIQTIFINARFLPTPDLVSAILALEDGQGLTSKGKLVAMRSTRDFETGVGGNEEYTGDAIELRNITDVFSLNGKAIELDVPLWKENTTHTEVDASNIIVGDPRKVLMAEGAKMHAATLNTKDGYIILDRDAEVMEGSLIRGPFYLGEHSTLKLGAKIYGPTTIGPHCKVGGEVSNSVIFGYSNKAHDGFIGNSILGEWCNLGADTNSSNLKNNYSEVKIWNYAEGKFSSTDLTFCGLIMGDHSKTGINTMLNTGTVVGVFANIFGGGFPPKHIPSFSWGGSEGFESYDIEKALLTASRVMERRQLSLTNEMKDLYRFLGSASQ